MGWPCVLSSPLPVEDMVVSVEETTLPTTVAMAVSCVEMAVMPASERMEETRD